MPLADNLNLIITLVASSVTAFLGILVLFHDNKSVSSRIFFVLSIIGALWAFVNYFSITVPPSSALFWIRGVILLATPHVFLFFLFVLNFPGEILQIHKTYLRLLLSLMAAMMLIAVTPLGFKDITIDQVSPNSILPSPGILLPVFGVTIVAITILTVGLIIFKYFHSDTFTKKRWLSIGAGLLVAYPLLIYLVFLRVNLLGDTTFVPYSPLLLLPIFIGATYAIIRHNLFNIKVIATESFTFFILIISFIQVIAAESLTSRILGIGTTIFLVIFGTFLIKSVLREVQAREEIERLAKDLEKANARLRELDQLKSEFLSFASHQIRSPLTAIKGYASLILEGTYGKITKQIKDPVDRIFQSSHALAMMVDDFLNISRIEQGGMKYDFQMTDFRKLVEDSIAEQQPNIKGKKLAVALTVEPPEANYNLKIDGGKIKQVVMNLIDNSIKYTPKGSINLTLRMIDRKIQLEITDTGIGFNKETLPKLFAKFSRDKNANKVNIQGTGLGLYLAKEIVEAHHGHIWAQSPGDGKGSSFFVEFYTDLIIGS